MERLTVSEAPFNSLCGDRIDSLLITRRCFFDAVRMLVEIVGRDLGEPVIIAAVEVACGRILERYSKPKAQRAVIRPIALIGQVGRRGT